MYREMSWNEYMDWQAFYAMCGGYPHEVEDVRWARSVLATAYPGEGKPPLKLIDFMMVKRESTAEIELDKLTAPTQESVDFINRLVANG